MDLAEHAALFEKLKAEEELGSHPQKIGISIAMTKYGQSRARAAGTLPEDVPQVMND